ncbi:trimethylguanosine synthase [Cryptococcus neoformans]|nr:trimethylguanosine synthase [Cryptococcus neoformans var. grubii Th84]OXH10727.1 trimethylguanosine synthase [Cryptococcus neoformans var. grubii]OXH31448.1 trimethylguanosine synthase [Cryptococcus neoformans var. grubii]OXH51719.1 trimethylguanosine synthase [Cryptococcus neoformans var. grubii]OXH51940.1 trimethylguanosine synthase [Cryptococcus neoformans var. grubii]
MPKRGRQSLSLFTSLPEDLRRSIRSKSGDATQLTVQHPVNTPTLPVDSLFSTQTLLRTQPYSDNGGEEEQGEKRVDLLGIKSILVNDSGTIDESGEKDTILMEVSQAQIPVERQSPPNQNESHRMETSASLSPTGRRKSESYDVNWLGSTNKIVKLSTAKARKQAKKRQCHAGTIVNPHIDHPWDCTGLVPRFTHIDHVPRQLQKYFRQRGLLFPEYDRLPLLLDHTGWFSVTPQPIAAHIAERCQCDVIVDAFCGVGGNAIAFAKTCERVIAIDNDITRLKLARHNALHHGVADRIEFILGDYTDFARSFAEKNPGDKIDVVFLSPPWGGIDYLNSPSETYSLSSILPIHGKDLFNLTSKLTPNIAYYLPRNMDMQEISELARELDYPDPERKGRVREWVEVEEETVRDKVKALTVYYGALVADE